MTNASLGGSSVESWRPDDVQAEVISRNDSILLLGAAGSGKSTTIRAVSKQETERLGADRVLGITHDRSQARSWQAEVAQQISGLAPRIATVVGLAGTVLMEVGGSAPLLLTAPEQELRVRDLLAGSVANRSVDWPEEWATAIGTRSFARQLRRAISVIRLNGWEPEELIKHAEQQRDYEWRAIAQFAAEYLQILDWEGSVDYVEAVLRAFRFVDSGAWTGQPFAAVAIDDAQDLALLELRFVRSVMTPGARLIAAADPDQGVWSYRGADLTALTQLAADTSCLALPMSYRGSDVLRDARDRLMRSTWYPGLPAGTADSYRGPAIHADRQGQLHLLEFDDAAAQSAHIAARLRIARASGVRWREMAVLAASAQDIPEIVRGLSVARIPVSVPTDDVPLVSQPAVATLLAAARLSLSWGRDSLDAAQVEHVLSSELGGLSAADLRAMRRWLRVESVRRGTTLTAADLCVDPELRDAIPKRLERVSQRVDELTDRLAVAAREERGGRPPAEVLWGLWDGVWPHRLRERALQAGPLAIAADRDLDAVMQLFRLAQRAPERWGGTKGLRAFLAEVESQEIAAEPDLQQQSHRDQVAVMSLRRGKGRHWRQVIVTGVQESVFGGGHPAEGLIQLGRLTPTELLTNPAQFSSGEERRMLNMALGRSSGDVVFCAAGGEADPPAMLASDTGCEWQQVVGQPEVPYSPVEIVARLRSTALDPKNRPGAARSVAQLARPANDGKRLVPAANPTRWPGVSDWTTAPAPIRDLEQPIAMSASAVANLTECPLRWFWNRETRGSRPSGQAARFGEVVHEAVSQLIAIEQAGDVVDLEHLLDDLWQDDGYDAEWHAADERRAALEALERAQQWLDGRWTSVESEVDLDVVVPVANAEFDIRIIGRMDLVERSIDGPNLVWDFKTKRTPYGAAETEESQQLRTYQLGLAFESPEDASSEGSAGGGAGFVQLNVAAGKRAENPTGPKIVQQSPAVLADHVDHLTSLGDVIRSESYPARPGDWCRTCDFVSSCPAKSGSQ